MILRGTAYCGCRKQAANKPQTQVRYRTDEVSVAVTLAPQIPRYWERIMADVYVYRFIGWDGPPAPEVKRLRATLDAIKEIGDPIMESQIVVDDAELDCNGFFRGSVANDSDPTEDLTDEINSLTLRADARDREALKLDEAAGGAQKYMLQLESRELRKQAQKLQRQQKQQRQSEFAAARSGDHSDLPDFAQFGASPTAG
jgi:hypothetical protein